VDGNETPILAANAVMRAVLLPPGAKLVVMTYQPFARGLWAILLYLFGGILLILGSLTALRAQNSRQSRIAACTRVDGPRMLSTHGAPPAFIFTARSLRGGTKLSQMFCVPPIASRLLQLASQEHCMQP
jgi:hypothetical protein